MTKETKDILQSIFADSVALPHKENGLTDNGAPKCEVEMPLVPGESKPKFVRHRSPRSDLRDNIVNVMILATMFGYLNALIQWLTRDNKNFYIRITTVIFGVFSLQLCCYLMGNIWYKTHRCLSLLCYICTFLSVITLLSIKCEDGQECTICA